MNQPKDYAEDGINGNRGTAQQVKVGDTTPAWVIIMAIVTAIVALILAALGWWMALNALRDASDAIRDATEARMDSVAAAQRADIAERRANISELYSKQVFVELNRLGYPVKTPAEEHSVAPVEGK